jgi:anti-sigma regulatory factor (Ser/Thr protein kinase)
MSQRAASTGSVNFKFELNGSPGERALFAASLDDFARANHWTPAITHETQLILEEWLTNVLTHGRAGRVAATPLLVTIQISIENNAACVEICDNGVAFDPTNIPEPNLEIPVEEREIGGLGILMMRRLVAEIRHERRGEWNFLFLKKSLARPALANSKQDR